MVSGQGGFSSFPKAIGYRLALSSDFGVRFEPSMQSSDHLMGKEDTLAWFTDGLT